MKKEGESPPGSAGRASGKRKRALTLNDEKRIYNSTNFED